MAQNVRVNRYEGKESGKKVNNVMIGLMFLDEIHVILMWSEFSLRYPIAIVKVS